MHEAETSESCAMLKATVWMETASATKAGRVLPVRRTPVLPTAMARGAVCLECVCVTKGGQGLHATLTHVPTTALAMALVVAAFAIVPMAGRVRAAISTCVGTLSALDMGCVIEECASVMHCGRETFVTLMCAPLEE